MPGLVNSYVKIQNNQNLTLLGSSGNKFPANTTTNKPGLHVKIFYKNIELSIQYIKSLNIKNNIKSYNQGALNPQWVNALVTNFTKGGNMDSSEIMILRSSNLLMTSTMVLVLCKFYQAYKNHLALDKSINAQSINKLTIKEGDDMINDKISEINATYAEFKDSRHKNKFTFWIPEIATILNNTNELDDLCSDLRDVVKGSDWDKIKSESATIGTNTPVAVNFLTRLFRAYSKKLKMQDTETNNINTNPDSLIKNNSYNKENELIVNVNNIAIDNNSDNPHASNNNIEVQTNDNNELQGIKTDDNTTQVKNNVFDYILVGNYDTTSPLILDNLTKVDNQESQNFVKEILDDIVKNIDATNQSEEEMKQEMKQKYLFKDVVNSLNDFFGNNFDNEDNSDNEENQLIVNEELGDIENAVVEDNNTTNTQKVDLLVSDKSNVTNIKNNNEVTVNDTVEVVDVVEDNNTKFTQDPDLLVNDKSNVTSINNNNEVTVNDTVEVVDVVEDNNTEITQDTNLLDNNKSNETNIVTNNNESNENINIKDENVENNLVINDNIEVKGNDDTVVLGINESNNTAAVNQNNIPVVNTSTQPSLNQGPMYLVVEFLKTVADMVVLILNGFIALANKGIEVYNHKVKNKEESINPREYFKFFGKNAFQEVGTKYLQPQVQV